MSRPAGIAVLLLAGCARTEHTPVDLQVDVEAALPAEADVVRFCVTDGIARRFGAASGRFALTGLRADEDPEIVVDVVDAAEIVIGRIGPLLIDAPYVVAAYEPCDSCARCEAFGDPPVEGEPSWTLGLRFSG